MRILHVVWRGRFSGAEILVRDLALHHRRQGHSVAIAGLGPTETSFASEVTAMEEAGVTWHAPRTPRGRLGRLFGLAQTVRSYAPDLIIAHSVIPGCFARTFAWRLPCPVMVVLHCGSFDDYAGNHPWLERLISRRAAAIVAVNPASLDGYRSRIGPHPCLRFIRNGVDLARYRSWPVDRATVRRDLGLGDHERVLLQVGRVCRIKRQHLTFAALAHLRTTGHAVTTLLAGPAEDDDYARQWRDDLTRLGLANEVRVLGGRNDIPGLLLAADAMVMPSETESQGLALIEGLAAGLPVVATDLPAFAPFKSLPGVTLLDPLDASAYAAGIVKALHTPRQHHDLDDWDLATTADNYLALASELIAAHRR